MLTPSELELLRADAAYARATPSEAGLRLLGATIEANRVALSTAAIPPGAIRLDALFAAFAAWGSPFGSQVSAYLIARIARALGAMHRTGRVPPIVDRAGIAVFRDGRVEILAFGCPALDVWLRPDGAPDVERAELDERDDVRALGSLYCELLSGQAHGAKPLPDPRPKLIEVLKRALAQDRLQRFESLDVFADAVEREAEPLGWREAPAVLTKLIDQWVERDVPRGEHAMLAGYFEQLESNDVVGAPLWAPAAIPKNAPLPAEEKKNLYDEWSAVLGEELPPAAPIAAPVISAEKPKLSLPPPPSSPAKSATSGSLPPGLDVAEILAQAAGSTRKGVPSDAKLKGGLSKSMMVQLAIGGIALMMAIAFYLSVPSVDEATDAITPERRIEQAVEAEPQPPPDLKITDDSQPVQPQAEPEGPAKGIVTVMSRPLGATVEIDGSYFGKTPLVRKERLTNRSYQITVLLDGYKPWTEKAFVDPANGAINVMAVLESEAK